MRQQQVTLVSSLVRRAMICLACLFPLTTPALLLLFLGVLSAFPSLAYAATYYTCANGSSCGSGWATGSDSSSCTSKSAPCSTISGGVGKMAGGDTLVIGNGTYTQAISNAPSGSGSKYTIIKAENDGGVKLDGGSDLISFSGSYVSIEGLTITGSGYVIRFPGSNNRLLRAGIGSKSESGDSSIVSLGGSYNLIEDCWIWGAGRGGIYVGGDHGTMRRVVIRKDYHAAESEDVAILLYHGTNATMDNVIAIDFNGASVSANYGDFRTGFRSREGYDALNHNFYGSIALNIPSPYLGFVLSVGSCDNCVAWDVGSTGIKGAAESGYHINQSTASSISARSSSQSSNATSASTYLLRPSGSSGARVEYRYENGQLTNIPLWPWPNENRIKRDFQTSPHQNPKRGFAADGNGLYGGPITLTSYIWEYLGNRCPSDICSDGGSSGDPTAPTAPRGFALK